MSKDIIELLNCGRNKAVKSSQELDQENGIWLTSMWAYGSLIKENIDNDALLISYPFNQELIQGIYELILETVLCRNEEILIDSNCYRAHL